MSEQAMTLTSRLRSKVTTLIFGVKIPRKPPSQRNAPSTFSVPHHFSTTLYGSVVKGDVHILGVMTLHS